MPEEVVKILRPASEGTHTDYGVTGDNKWSASDPLDPINHDTTTYIGTGSGGALLYQSLQSDGLFPSTSFIVKVEVHVRNYRLTSSPGNNHFALLTRLGTVDVFSAEIDYPVAYVSIYKDVTSTRPGGGAWAYEDFLDATFEWGIRRAFNGPSTRSTSLWVEVTYIPTSVFVEAFRDVWSRRVRRSRFAEQVYQVKVPLEFLALELLDELNVSHHSLPRAASHIADLEKDGLVKEWQRLYALNVEQRINLNDMSMVLGFSDLEPYMCIFWSTEKAPYTVDETIDGLAQTNNGALMTFDRSTYAWISQASGQVVAINPGQEKTNHIGTIQDEARTNLIKNSNFQDGVASIWTTVAGGGAGAVADDTGTLLFADASSYPKSVKVTRGSAETYIHQNITAPGTNGFRTMTFDHRNSETKASWWLQRAADSLWWDDTGEEWVSGRYENVLGTYDSDNIINERSVSNPIEEATGADTWTLQVGIGSDDALEGDVIYLYQVDAVEGQFVVERLITDDTATFTSLADNKRWAHNLETGDTPRQTWPVDRGTIRCTFTPNNGGGRLQDGDELTLLLGVVGDVEATSPTDYDVLLYEKQSGENVRFTFARYINSALAGSVSKDHVCVRDTAVELAVRTTSDVNEFGLITSGGTDYDGVNDYYTRGSDLTGSADGKVGLFSCWLRWDGGDAAIQGITSNTGSTFTIRKDTTNKLHIVTENSSGTKILEQYSTTTYTVGVTWYNILISWDLANNKAYIYSNDASVGDTPVTLTDDDIDYTVANWGIGASYAGAIKLNGALAELYFSLEYLDISVEANRRKFISAAGLPVPLGAHGATPTSNVPIIYSPRGDGVNMGSGGQLSPVGAPVPVVGPATSAFDIYVDGVAGDVAESKPHDTDALESELWIGSAPSGTGYLRGMGAISDIEIIQRVMPAEEISARR